jgi:hypothetical protein
MRLSGFDETGQDGARVTCLTLEGILLLQWLGGPNQPEARTLPSFPDVPQFDGDDSQARPGLPEGALACTSTGDRPEISGEKSMVHTSPRFRNVLTRGLAAMALLALYGVGLIGGSVLLLEVSTSAAFARGGHGSGGFRHGGFGFYPYYPYYGNGGYWPYYGDAGVCYAVRQRVKTRYGWGIRRVSVCE